MSIVLKIAYLILTLRAFGRDVAQRPPPWLSWKSVFYFADEELMCRGELMLPSWTAKESGLGLTTRSPGPRGLFPCTELTALLPLGAVWRRALVSG